MMARTLRMLVVGLLAASGLVVAVFGFPAAVEGLGASYVAFQVLLEVVGLVAVAAGATLLLHDDRHPVGWCLLWVGVVNLLQYNDALFGRFDSPWVATAMGEWLSGSFFVALITVVVVFPDGLGARPARARRAWRLALVACWVGVLLSALVDTVGGGDTPFATWPNPLPGAVLPPQAGAVFFPLTLVVLVVAVVALVRRGRRQSAAERRRYRMVELSMAAVPVAVGVGLALAGLVPDLADSGLVWVPAAASFGLLPAAFMAAILRYGLYDIDRLVSRTVTWSILALVVTAAYAGPVLLLSLAFGRGNDLAVAVATLVAATLVAPARRRVQAVVDRRFDRARYDAELEALAFADRVRGAVDLATLADDLQAVVDRTLAPATRALWLVDR